MVNHGIPGSSLTPDGYGRGNTKAAVMTLADGKGDADLITLEVVPNEGAVVGDIYDTDDESFCGCLNQMPAIFAGKYKGTNRPYHNDYAQRLSAGVSVRTKRNHAVCVCTKGGACRSA